MCLFPPRTAVRCRLLKVIELDVIKFEAALKLNEYEVKLFKKENMLYKIYLWI